MKKTKNIIGSTQFWKIIAIMLILFIVAAGTVFVIIANRTDTTVTLKQEETVQSVSQDHSYEATKERVDSINDNYGREVKATYEGSTSTMEKMMQQRMFFSGLKTILIAILIVLVILLILVKGFGLSIFGRKKVERTGEAEKPAEVPEKKSSPVKKSVPEQKKPEFKKAEDIPVEKKAEEPPKDADEAEIAESCQLP